MDTKYMKVMIYPQEVIACTYSIPVGSIEESELDIRISMFLQTHVHVATTDVTNFFSKMNKIG